MKNNILVLLTLCMTVGACVKIKLEETYSKQETQIDTYLSKNNTAEREIEVTETDPDTGETVTKIVKRTDSLRIEYNKGAARLVRVEGTGEPLSETGSVSFYYAGYTFTGNPSALFATNHEETATAPGSGFILTEPDYSLFEADMRDIELLNGLRNGLIGVQAGEECEILFSGKYAFGNQVFGIIPAKSALLFKIWVIGVSND